MAIWDFRPKVDLGTGLALGVGALVAPVVIPMAWSAVRPVLKTILKGGFLLYEAGRGTVAFVTGGPDSTSQEKSAPLPTENEPGPVRPEQREKLARAVEHMREKDHDENVKPARVKEPKRPALVKTKRQRKETVKKPEKE